MLFLFFPYMTSEILASTVWQGKEIKDTQIKKIKFYRSTSIYDRVTFQ